MRRALFLLVLAACGGGGGSASGPKTPTGGGGEDPLDKSLGEYIANQGGVPMLGGRPGGGGGSAPEGLYAGLVEKDHPVKLDGVLDEWPPRTKAKLATKGSPKTSFSITLQYDDAKLYAGVEIENDKPGDRHVSLVLAFPGGGNLAAYELELKAGKPGETAGAVKYLSGGRRGQEVAGAKLVEAPNQHGYTFEAAIPWSTFPEARMVKVGLRGVARYHEADAVSATGPGEVTSPDKLPALPTESELSMIENLLGPRHLLGQAPKLDMIVDVAGDPTRERVTVFGSYLTICGSAYLGGTRFYYKELQGEVVKLEARDVLGRGKEDLILRRRLTTPTGSREVLEVLSGVGGEELHTVFAHEIAVVAGTRKIVNSVHLGSKEIDVTAESASGWDAASYKEQPVEGTEPVLLPWAVKSRSYKFENGRFTRGKEETVAGAAPVASATHGARPPEPPTPPVRPSTGDMSKQLLELYRKDRGIPDLKPKFDLEVHVAEDPRPERVLLMGKDIVVFGPGFRGGREYATITLAQFNDPADVKELTARDLTGDGAADLVVRGTRKITPQGGGDPVELDVMFVYEVKGSSIARIFGIETGREQSGKRVQGLVQFVPAKGGKSFEIDVRPGRATGWTEKSYPWPQEQPGGTIEPLLLPWGAIPSLRYSYNGTQFAK